MIAALEKVAFYCKGITIKISHLIIIHLVDDAINEQAHPLILPLHFMFQYVNTATSIIIPVINRSIFFFYSYISLLLLKQNSNYSTLQK